METGKGRGSIVNASGGAASGSNRVNRGGRKSSYADNSTVSNRNYNDPNNRNTDCETRSNLPNYRYGILGFRLVRPSQLRLAGTVTVL